MSWTPSPPHDPRDDTRDDTVYNSPIGRVSHSPRFPGFLLAAVIAALIAFAALGAMLFSDRGGTVDPSRSPRPTSSAPAGTRAPGSSALPGTTDAPDPTDVAGPGPTGSPGSSMLVQEVCDEPVEAVAGVRQSVIDAFRDYCLEGVAAVLDEIDGDAATVRELAWGYAADTPPSPGADLPAYVYLALDDQARIRRYLVVTDAAGGPPTVTGAGRVPALPQDVFFSLSGEIDR